MESINFIVGVQTGLKGKGGGGGGGSLKSTLKQIKHIFVV